MSDAPPRKRDHEMEVTIIGFGALLLVLLAGWDLFRHKWWAFLVWCAVAALGVARVAYLRRTRSA